MVARPQALTCQGRRRSAAAAHAKGPARPVMQSAFRAKGLWRKDLQFFNFFDVYTAIFFQNPCCAARGHALAVWHRYAPPRYARRPNALRAGATKIQLITTFSLTFK